MIIVVSNKNRLLGPVRNLQQLWYMGGELLFWGIQMVKKSTSEQIKDGERQQYWKRLAPDNSAVTIVQFH